MNAPEEFDAGTLTTLLAERADNAPMTDADPFGRLERRIKRRRTTQVGLVAAFFAVAVIGGGLALAGRNNQSTIATTPVQRAENVKLGGGGVAHPYDLGNGRMAFVANGFVFVMDGADGSVRQITKNGEATDLAWSRDGEWISFSVRGGEDYTTYVARADGSNARGLRTGNAKLVWSPIGIEFAYTTDTSLMIGTPDGDARRVATLQRSNGKNTPVWSPDGGRLAYADGNAVKVVNRDGSNPVSMAVPEVGDSGWNVPVSWWWDGQGLLIGSWVFNDPSKSVLVSTAIGGEAVTLANGYVESPDTGQIAWKDDGSGFAFAPWSLQGTDTPIQWCTVTACDAQPFAEGLQGVWLPGGMVFANFGLSGQNNQQVAMTRPSERREDTYFVPGTQMIGSADMGVSPMLRHDNGAIVRTSAGVFHVGVDGTITTLVEAATFKAPPADSNQGLPGGVTVALAPTN